MTWPSGGVVRKSSIRKLPNGEQAAFQAVDPGSISGRRIEIYFLYFLLTPCQGNIVINTCEGESETERQTTWGSAGSLVNLDKKNLQE